MPIAENRSTGLLAMFTQASAHSVRLHAGITGIVLKTLAGMAAPGRAGYALSGTVTITNACAAVAETGLKFTTLRN